MSHVWSAVWPNLLASVIWVPVSLIHVTRSNRKQLKVFIGERELYWGNKPGPDNEEAE